MWEDRMTRLQSLIGPAMDRLEREIQGGPHAFEAALAILKTVGLYRLPLPKPAETNVELLRACERSTKELDRIIAGLSS